jgi:hypothetical protein
VHRRSRFQIAITAVLRCLPVRNNIQQTLSSRAPRYPAVFVYPSLRRIEVLLGAIRRDLVIVLIFVANFYFIHLFEVILLMDRLPDLGLSLWWGQLLFLLLIFFIILLLYTILVVFFLVNRSRLWGCLGLFSWLLNGSGLSFALLSSRRSFCFPKLAFACREAQFGVLQG